MMFMFRFIFSIHNHNDIDIDIDIDIQVEVYDVTMLRCYDVTMLRCYDVTMLKTHVWFSVRSVQVAGGSSCALLNTFHSRYRSHEFTFTCAAVCKLGHGSFFILILNYLIFVPAKLFRCGP